MPAPYMTDKKPVTTLYRIFLKTRPTLGAERVANLTDGNACRLGSGRRPLDARRSVKSLILQTVTPLLQNDHSQARPLWLELTPARPCNEAVGNPRRRQREPLAKVARPHREANGT
jgi:hypothetical protein